jgi:thiamine biosynthesis lipoprotein
MSGRRRLRRVEHHMSTAITLAADDLDDATADRFFARIAELEALLTRFRPTSEVSRFAAGTLAFDELSPEVREVLDRCEAVRTSTSGDFEHEPRARSGDPADPVLDVNALAKGWIVEEAATILRLATDGRFCVNAGGDVLASGGPWRVGIQHPDVPGAVLGVLEVTDAAVATSGTYERGQHLRRPSATAPPLRSVTVVGPHLAEADALATAAYAAGGDVPSWWPAVAVDHGLLTMTASGRVRWRAPIDGPDVRWVPPDTTSGSRPRPVERSVPSGA